MSNQLAARGSQILKIRDKGKGELVMLCCFVFIGKKCAWILSPNPKSQFVESRSPTSCYNSLTMNWHKTTLEISTQGKGLHDITETIRSQLQVWGVREGMCFLFLPHTSASLVMSENWDPTARADLETFMERTVPEGDRWYTHTLEGDDDATSHIRAMLTDTSLTVPIDEGNLSLGTWQGIYVFEHRARPHQRKVLMRALSVE